MTATYTKMNNGAWGLRITPASAAVSGQPVTVTKRDGLSKTETIGAVVWRAKDGSVALAFCAGTSSAAPRQSSYDRGNRAPGGRRCPMCGSASCSRAWNNNDLCDED